jgi:hypothetical protein
MDFTALTIFGTGDDHATEKPWGPAAQHPRPSIVTRIRAAFTARIRGERYTETVWNNAALAYSD